MTSTGYRNDEHRLSWYAQIYTLFEIVSLRTKVFGHSYLMLCKWTHHTFYQKLSFPDDTPCVHSKDLWKIPLLRPKVIFSSKFRYSQQREKKELWLIIPALLSVEEVADIMCQRVADIMCQRPWNVQCFHIQGSIEQQENVAFKFFKFLMMNRRCTSSIVYFYTIVFLCSYVLRGSFIQRYLQQFDRKLKIS